MMNKFMLFSQGSHWGVSNTTDQFSDSPGANWRSYSSIHSNTNYLELVSDPMS